ncbi:2Fe-2S iron-sulfur cluster-binding protein, partial [Thermodesulfobacteriota bacterium]
MKKPKATHKKPKRKPRRLVNKATRKMVWLNVLPGDIWIKVRRGNTVWKALQNTEIELEGDCGGLGKCGKCRIKVITPIGEPSPDGKELLNPEELEQGIRLACRTKIRKNLAIYTEHEDDETEFFQILKHGQLPPVDLNPLIERVMLDVPPPSRDNSLSDVHRIQHALSPDYQGLKITHRCLSYLYRNIRSTDFSGAAIIHNNCLLEWRPKESISGVFGLIFDLG